MMIVSLVVEKAGGCSKLAKQLGISHVAVLKWKNVPVKRLATVERITGIPREELRPDIFGKEEWTKGKGKS